MDESIRQEHARLGRALNQGAGAADLYDEHATLAPPGHPEVIQGREAIRRFLVAPGLAPIEFVILEAERVGARGHAIAAYEQGDRTGTSLTVFAENAGAWRVVAGVYGDAFLPHAIDEWKECRASIDRFDKLITDVRKYGFTLITGLLTASAFWLVSSNGATVPGAARAGASFVLMVLVLALFTVDRSLEVFLRSAVSRARDLEAPLGMKLTALIGDIAEKSHIATWAAWLYTLFMIGALVPSFVASGAWVLVVSIGLDVVFVLAIWFYHYWTKAGLAGQAIRSLVRADFAAVKHAVRQRGGAPGAGP